MQTGQTWHEVWHTGPSTPSYWLFSSFFTSPFIKGRNLNEKMTEASASVCLVLAMALHATGDRFDIARHVTPSFIKLLQNKLQWSLILNFWCDCLQQVLKMHRFQRNANLLVTQKVLVMGVTTLQMMKYHLVRLHVTTMHVIQKMKTTVKIQRVWIAYVLLIELCVV